jgi:hypothetical protein
VKTEQGVPRHFLMIISGGYYPELVQTEDLNAIRAGLCGFNMAVTTAEMGKNCLMRHCISPEEAADCTR